MAVKITTHQNIEPEENHGIISKTYPDEAARLADATWTPADIGRVARQLFDNRCWWIFNVIPGTPNTVFWSELCLCNVQTNLEMPTMLMQLTPNTTYIADSSGADFGDFTGTILKSTTDASWDPGSQKIILNHTGFYRVTVDARMIPIDSYYILDNSRHGSRIDIALSEFNFSLHISNNSTSGYPYGPEPRLSWHDEFYINASVAFQQAKLSLYFSNLYTGYSDVSLDAVVSVQKLL